MDPSVSKAAPFPTPVVSFLSDIELTAPRHTRSITDIPSKSVPAAMTKGRRVEPPKAQAC